MISRTMLSAAFAAALVSGAATAAGLSVYPAKGQSGQQQQKDEGECYVWAKNRTGIDPANVSAAPSSQPTGDVARGAARGAVAGAVIADVSGGNAGRGAGAGAVIGGMRGAARSNQRQAQAAQQSQAGAIQTFNNANAACLEGRGYSVK